MPSDFFLLKTPKPLFKADTATPINCTMLDGCPIAQTLIARQVIAMNSKMYVGSITTPIANQVKT